MEWWLALSIIIGGLLFVMALGVPVAFSFLLITAVGAQLLQGGDRAFDQMVLNLYSSVASFTLAPVPMFVLMGEVLWHSKMGGKAIDALDKLLGRLPGRLSVLTIGSGAIFSSLSGSTMANTAILGTFMLPELERRGYHRSLSIGPIMAGGGLAMMIPPSALAVILAAIGQLSIAKILIAALIPGILMALLYLLYIVIRSLYRPQDAPSYEVAQISWREKIVGVAIHLLPLGVLIFLVTGLIVLGIATPTESGAVGALGSFALAAAHRKLNWRLIRDSVVGSLRITVLMFAIVATAVGFSQLLAYSGATRQILAIVTSADMGPILLIICMQLIVLALGCFMEQISIMLITMPIFIPIVSFLGMDPIWFGVLMLINLETALMTPPFGLLLFVLKGVAPPGVSMREIYASAFPYILCNIAVMAMLIIWPEITSVVHQIVSTR